MSNDLFQPSLQDYKKKRHWLKPWSSRAQLMVAFFGGTLAFALFAHKNNQRLGVNAEAEQKTIQIGIGMTIVTFILPIVLLIFSPDILEENTRIIRYGNRAVAVIMYYWVEAVQRPFLRTYLMDSDSEPFDDPWKQGLLHVFGWGTLHGIVLGIMIFIAHGVING